MPGLVPGIRVLLGRHVYVISAKAWMDGTSPAMTVCFDEQSFG